MRRQEITDAVLRAKEFVVMGGALLNEIAESDTGDRLIGPSPRHAATRRKSLDLTRALAAMRKS